MHETFEIGILESSDLLANFPVDSQSFVGTCVNTAGKFEVLVRILFEKADDDKMAINDAS